MAPYVPRTNGTKRQLMLKSLQRFRVCRSVMSDANVHSRQCRPERNWVNAITTALIASRNSITQHRGD